MLNYAHSSTTTNTADQAQPGQLVDHLGYMISRNLEKLRHLGDVGSPRPGRQVKERSQGVISLQCETHGL